MATRGREDRTRDFFRDAEFEFARRGHRAARRSTTRRCACWRASRRKTLNDDQAVRDWIDMFTMWPTKPTPGLRSQIRIAPEGNRLPAYRNITAPVAGDRVRRRLVLPPHLSREVADAIPNGRYLQIPDTGHLGFIERPDAVNAAVLEFFAAGV